MEVICINRSNIRNKCVDFERDVKKKMFLNRGSKKDDKSMVLKPVEVGAHGELGLK